MRAPQVATLDQIVEKESEEVWARVAAAGSRGPLCLVALYAGSMSPHAEEVSALTERTRDRLLRGGRPGDAFESLWLEQEDWDLRDRTEPAGETVDDAQMDLERALERAGCEDSEVAILLELAYRMSRHPAPPGTVSEDFACVVVEVGEPEVTMERFVACARPEVLASYRDRGWLADSAEARAPVRAGTYELSAAAARRLDELVAREAQDVRRSVARAVGDERVCMVGFIWADPQTATATHVYAFTGRERDAAMRDGASDEALERLWTLSSWAADDVLGREDEAATYAFADRVVADLEAVNCPEPEEAFLHELAYRLSRDPGDLRVTDDFGCFAVEHELIHEAPIAFQASATPEAVDAYERRGWLRFPGSFDWP